MKEEAGLTVWIDCEESLLALEVVGVSEEEPLLNIRRMAFRVKFNTLFMSESKEKK